MKLYTTHGPNPQFIDRVIAFKGIEIERVWIDIGSAENRREPYLSTVNPAGTTPVLELDNGSRIADIIAISEYLDVRFPDPPLLGKTPEAQAVSRIWVRRVDLTVCEPLANAYRFGKNLAMFAPRMRCLPEAAEGLKAVAQDGMAWIDRHFTGPWLAGAELSLADILLHVFLDFGAKIADQPMPDTLARLQEWVRRMDESRQG